MLKEFGEDLKFLRETKNITIAEISAETRINSKFFINIESGNFDFQPETYIRAFLKEYANSIGEDETQILHDYEKAKSGFYTRKFVVKDGNTEDRDNRETEEALTASPVSEENVRAGDVNTSKNFSSSSAVKRNQYETGIPYGYFDSSDYESVKINQKKRLNQKIFVGIIIAVIVGGIIFLINYLNRSSVHKQISDVKPKTFGEMSEDYENKIKGRTEKDIADSIKNLNTVTKSDSLTLIVRAVKEARIKVYLDENNLIEETIPAGDSLSLKAREQFRFSAAANSSIDLYLNGKPLQKLKTSTGTPIKNLIIRKDGIVTQ